MNEPFGMGISLYHELRCNRINNIKGILFCHGQMAGLTMSY